MVEIDTLALLRKVYSEALSLHYDLYDKSNVHREQHGEQCTVYPSSPAQAPLWPLLTMMVQARRFLEIGCGLGYTAALMAEAGGPGCRVDTVEAVKEHADLAEQEFSRRGLADRIHVLRGEARNILSDLSEPYDVIFMDADWREYPQFLPHLVRLTRPAGVLVTANLSPLFAEWDRGVQAYLSQLVRENRFRTYIIPEIWNALSYRLPDRQ